MQLSHTRRVVSATFDDPNLVSVAGLVPVMKLAQKAGLRSLADEWLSVPTDKGANAGLKVSSLVGGMVAGADSIDDMAVLRHGAMGKVFDRPFAPTTLGSFLRTLPQALRAGGPLFGHVRQLDAVASRFLGNLAEQAPLLPGAATDDADGGYVFVDVDDTIIEVHGYAKQGSGYGYSGVRGINALLATVKTTTCAPVIIGQRLRRGACGSPRGAAKLIGDALACVKRLRGTTGARVLFRADSAFYGYACLKAAIRAGAAVSVTARMDKAVRRAIASIGDQAWEAIEYTKWAIHVSAVVVPVPDQRAFAEWGPASGGPAVESARGVAERHGRSSVSAASVPGHSRAPGGCPTRPVGCGLATSAL